MLVLDAYRAKGWDKSRTCYCDGWWFPHRLKSEGCNHRPTMDDIPALLDCIETTQDNPPF